VSAASVIGWREWVALPDLGVEAIKAKIDTGARSSSLHAYDLELYERSGHTWARFVIHPMQRETRTSLKAEALVSDMRSVRSSTGHAQERPVILTRVAWSGALWTIELTLANRDEMGFRMLLGRESVRNRYLVDAGRSYYGGVPPGRGRRRKKKRKRES